MLYMKRLLLSICTLFPFVLSAQGMAIEDFVVKENLSQNGKLAVIAVDSAQKAEDHIKGTFAFSVNGFKHSLQFNDGVAVLQLPVESSTFVLFKHKNHEKELGKLYYIHKNEKGLTPYKLSGLVLILIPAALLLIAYMFKRFLFMFVVLAIVFVYFNTSKGLQLSQILDSLFLAMKNLL